MYFYKSPMVLPPKGGGDMSPEGRLASLNLFAAFSALANSLSMAFWHLWASFSAALEPLPTLAVLSALLAEARLDEL